MKTAIDVRQKWLEYYNSLGFTTIPSAPLVHPAFPMSFNMSAGLIQLDPITRSKLKAKPKKQVLVQKCFRHFDMDKVGDDTHLTFFEMPGAFEIGIFNEAKTVEMLWKFYVDTLRIDPNKIWITSFNKETVHSTEITQNPEIIGLIKKFVGSRAILGNKDTNLWMQGGGINFADNMRLCGPQVEFFYPRAVKIFPGHNPLSKPESFLEIGNTISIKYYVDYTDMRIKELVNPSTESVIGLERVQSVIETDDINIFETSLFSPLFKTLNKSITPDTKIIVNNLKSLVFLFSEEYIQTGKDGRKRIIRNLIRNFLSSCYINDIDIKAITSLLIKDVLLIYEKSYPELRYTSGNVLEAILNHEPKYQDTLVRGKKEIDKYLSKNKLEKVTDDDLRYFKKQYGITQKLFQYVIKLKN